MIIIKKLFWKNKKKPFNIFKGTLIVSLCFFVVIYIYIYISLNIKLLLDWYDNNKKTIMKIQKYHLTQVLIFFIIKVFWSSYCIFKIKKELFIPITLIITNRFCEKTSMPQITSFKFFWLERAKS